MLVVADRWDVHGAGDGVRQSLTADLRNKADVGSAEGTSWSLTSAKPRHGIQQLMDDDLSTLWQCVGVLPRR